MNNMLSEEFERRKQDDFGLDEIILNAFDHHKLILFLGAGVSRADGICGWSDLANNLIKIAFPAYRENMEIISSGMSSKEKISIAYNRFKETNNLDQFYIELGKALKPQSQNSRNDRADKSIYDILSQFGVNYITTNADGLFENCLKSGCYEILDRTKLLNDNEYYKCTRYRRNQLFYLHGKYKEYDTEHNEKNLVFTADKYVKKYNDQGTIDFLREIFRPENGFVVLFVGYGLNEFELMDYIASKVYLYNRKTEDGKGQNNVFALEGFCSNQSLLFEVRKSYLRSLGIELLAYNMDENGYNELKNVLANMLVVFQSRPSQMYYDYADVEKFTVQYTPDNAQQLKIILKPKNEKVFQYAIRRLKKSSDFDKWGKLFLQDSDFFRSALQDYFDNANIGLSKLYFLLYLLEKNINDVQDKVSIFLDDICAFKERDKILKNNRELAIVLNYFISYLDEKHVTARYIDLLVEIFSAYTITILHGFRVDENFQVINWSSKSVRHYLDAVLSGIYNLDSMYNADSYILIKFLDAFDEISENKFAYILYDAIMAHIANKTSNGDVNEILFERNLDMLYNSKIYEYWQFYLRRLLKYFSLIKSNESKKVLLQKYLQSDNETVNKISLYIIRKNNIDTKVVSEYGAQCFNKAHCISELYLCLIGAKKTREENRIQFKAIIENSNFGLTAIRDDGWLLNMQRNAFYDILGLPVDQNYEIYDFKLLTSSTAPITLSDDKDESIREIEQMIESDDDLQSLIETAQKIHGKIHTIVEFANALLRLDDDKFSKRVNEIKRSNNYEFINQFLLASMAKFDGLTLPKEESIQHICIDILINTPKDNEKTYIVFKNIFSLMSKKPLLGSVVARTGEIDKLFDVFASMDIDYGIDGKCQIDNINPVVGALINNGDTDKWRFFVNYFDSRKRETHKNISKYELNRIIKVMDNRKYKLIFAMLFGWTCNSIDKLEDRERLYSIIIKDEEEINLNAFLIIIWNLRSLDTHYFETIKKYGVIEQIAQREDIDDVLLVGFCNFITSAVYYGRIDLDACAPLFARNGFIKNFLNCICSANNIIDDMVKKVLIPAKTLIASDISQEETNLIPILVAIYKRMKYLSREYVLLLKDILSCAKNRYMHFTVNDILKAYDIKDDELANAFVLVVIKKNLMWQASDWMNLLEYYKMNGNTNMQEKVLECIRNDQFISPEDYKHCYEMVHDKSNEEDMGNVRIL